MTVCTKDKTHVLGEVEVESLILSKIGRIVGECWLGIPNNFRNVELDQWIIMPNHLHGITLIHDSHRGEAFAEDHI